MKENKSNKINKFLLVTTILSMTILLIGGTFSYFTLSTMSKMNALAVSAGKVRLGLGVSPVYTGYPIIPLKDEYISTAYNRKCKDDLERGACLAYGLEVFNFEEKSEVEGTIDFHLNGLENLSFMVLDENDNVYLDITHIDKDNPTKNRGVKYANGSLGEVNTRFVPLGVLLEIAHHDNLEDASWIMTNKKLIGETIANSILKYFGII